MNRCYSARPHQKDEFRTTVKGKAAPQPCVFADEDRDDIVVTKKETIKSWLKIPKSELMNKRRSKKKWRTMMQLDTIEGREKAEWLKEARDYSFLSSDNSDMTTTSCENIIIPQVRRRPVVSSVINEPRNNILRRPVKKSIVKEKAPVSKKPLLSSKNDSKKETLISKEEIILPAKKKKNPLLYQESRKRKLVVHEEEDEEISTVFSDKREPVIRVPTKFSNEKEEVKTEATNFADIEKEETRSAKIAKIAEDNRQQEVITTKKEEAKTETTCTKIAKIAEDDHREQEVITTTKKSLRIRINIKTGVMIMV
ncbi:PREDICTED: uncharacterized protein LOC105960362 [Erythranthe guttata]|uniref:uncharacterized protein LOC105960362 n=1 Tax=Erythranthe guttata TaxID=4155 RepID=UPI00064DE24E|nr:PREDICTED: uncharacterized protein LOC105960362 [Erythranthe guttata]|eukprot:XP_012839971.1 PREDICTED: uncharacterized protein LOC105960362 [Erythranthe guttata]